ncbi:MAG: class I SAM-dependent methyltransferase [Dehalococcoidia bacterium]
MPLETYKKLCTEAYDLDKPEVPAEALLFYLQHLSAVKGPVLEPMCGSGRFLIPLLELGIDIDGVDASPEMLDSCRERCRQRGLEPVLYEQFLHDMSLPRQYGFVFMPSGSFGLVPAAQVSQSLKRLYDAMLPGGRLVMEIDTPRAQSKSPGRWVGWWVTRPDGAKVVASFLHRAYDADLQVEQSLGRYELFVNGQLERTELEEYTLQYYERPQFQRILESAGFTSVRAMKVYGDGEPDPGDIEIAFMCTRP